MVTLKNAVEAVVTDLRAMLRTESVPVGPISLVETLDTLDWIVRDTPVGQLATRAMVQTVEDCLTDLMIITSYADGPKNIKVRDRIFGAYRAIWPYVSALRG